MKTYKARNTKIFVQTPAFSSTALLPNASNKVRTTKTVVQPWYKENGRWMKSSSAVLSEEWCFLTI
jgi:hypothetical protein